jgi:hypothetical protein
MSTRGFLILIVAWGLAILVATIDIGGMFAFAAAVLITVLLVPALALFGLPPSWFVPVGWVFLAAYSALVVYLLVRGAVDLFAAQFWDARGRFGWAVSLGSAALVLWLSANTLNAAWYP